VTRVARIITRLNIGGPSIQAISLSRDLAAAGYHTCLIHGHLADREGDMTRLQPISAARTVYVNSLVRRISPLRDVRACWTIYRTLCRWKPDIVHTHQAKAGTLGRLAGIVYNWTAGQAGKARLIHTYHGHVFEGYFTPASTRLFLMVERWLARRTDALIAISPQVRDDLVRTFAIGTDAQVVVVPLGFDLTRFTAISTDDRASARRALGIPPDACVVTTVGRLTAIKAQSHFLRAARRLDAQGSFVFLVVGDGELRPELESEAIELGIAQSTRFLGWRGDLDTVYAATDVFVLTSRNEGTPVALIEAMAAGVACVSSDVGGVRDVVTSDSMGTLVPFDDIDGLAQAIGALAGDTAARIDMGLQARQAVRQRFDQSRLINDITAVYRRTLNKGVPVPRG
jgi:glycosyltransferase involved in cell wall biosynthesis